MHSVVAAHICRFAIGREGDLAWSFQAAIGATRRERRPRRHRNTHARTRRRCPVGCELPRQRPGYPSALFATYGGNGAVDRKGLREHRCDHSPAAQDHVGDKIPEPIHSIEKKFFGVRCTYRRIEGNFIRAKVFCTAFPRHGRCRAGLHFGIGRQTALPLRLPRTSTKESRHAGSHLHLGARTGGKLCIENS